MKEDSGRGWRHVVPSPRPQHYCDISLVEQIAKGGSVVIAGGGGGIPVVRGPKGIHHGVSAVIDKDLTSALMANVMGIELLIILTATPKVATNFGTPQQKFLDRVTLGEIQALQAAGHFPPGSMGPKIDAAIQFLKNGGKHVIIGDLNQAMDALRGDAGTHMVCDDA
jgi:carbamate kinase